MVVGASIDCYAQTGTVHLTVVKAQFIASTGSGTGTLNYQGRTYRLSVSSVPSAPAGSGGASWWAPATSCGRGGHRGTYKAAAAGLTVGGGAQVARFRNADGVSLELVGAQLG